MIRMSVVSGNNQTGTVGTQPATALAVLAVDGSTTNSEPGGELEVATGGSAYAGRWTNRWPGARLLDLGPAGAQTLEFAS
jgi:hypothetical protein